MGVGEEATCLKDPKGEKEDEQAHLSVSGHKIKGTFRV